MNPNLGAQVADIYRVTWMSQKKYRWGRTITRAGGVGAAIGGIIDIYILVKEGIYAGCGVPAGVY